MKIAMAQINPTIADIEGNRKKIIDNIRLAEEAGADIVVFPEMATIGCPPMDLLRYRKLIDDNLRSIELIAGACSRIAAICGYVDYDEKNNSMLFNSAAFMAGGKIISKHQKTLLAGYGILNETCYFSPAHSHSTINFMNQKIGITIYEDIWRNEASIKEGLLEPLKKENVDIIINISASPFVKGKKKLHIDMLRSEAVNNNTYIVCVNQVGGNDSLIFDGNSLALNNSGAIIAYGGAFTESLVVADTAKSENLTIEHNEIEDIRQALVLGIRDYAKKCGFTSCLLGLSGGIDSALVCVLAAEALGSKNVLGITMPSMYSSQGSIDDSIALAKNLGVEIKTIPINAVYSGFEKELAPFFQGMSPDITEENLQARIRGTLLMSISNKTGRLLLATGNKSEIAMGYCTLYGDMNGGLAPIADLPKTLVYELARHINKKKIIIPVETIEKPPSAELRENQKDEDTLPPYSVLDPILEHYVEERLSADEIVSRGFNADTVARVISAVNISEYKRKQAPLGLRVTGNFFWADGRIPNAHKYKA
ncbi:MAG: NAD+ synthase [Leptospirales bacterium]|nr:NAD+ synthase [Leptospirales bacterium]